MNKNVQVDIVSNELGDWEGLYINKKLVEEGHRIECKQLLEHLSNHFPIEYDTTDEVDSEVLPITLEQK